MGSSIPCAEEGDSIRSNIWVQLFDSEEILWKIEIICSTVKSSACATGFCPMGKGSAGHYRDTLSRYFIVICFSLSFIAIKKSFSLSIYRYRDTFVPKSAIIDNKIQQVIEKQFHT